MQGGYLTGTSTASDCKYQEHRQGRSHWVGLSRIDLSNLAGFEAKLLGFGYEASLERNIDVRWGSWNGFSGRGSAILSYLPSKLISPRS